MAGPEDVGVLPAVTGRVMQSSASSEWYTPETLLHLARMAACCDQFDLDPASTWLANQTVDAKGFYTRHEDGLKMPWSGKVWINPPYDRSGTQWAFARRAEEQAPQCDAIVGLWRAAVGSRGFEPLWRADALCFWRGRICFGQIKEGQVVYGLPAAFDIVLAYWGPKPEWFARVFLDHGHVVRPSARPPSWMAGVTESEVSGD